MGLHLLIGEAPGITVYAILQRPRPWQPLCRELHLVGTASSWCPMLARLFFSAVSKVR